MKNRLRMIKAIFFILMLALPLQVFAHGEEDDGHSTDSAPWLKEQGNKTDDHGHDEAVDHGHDDGGHEDGGHGGEGGHDDGHEDGGHGEAGHEDESHEDGGHGEAGHGDGGHEESYEEVGPNYPVLGTFAAINGGFLLFGAFRKISSNKRMRGVQ
jgi:hypothetical protein